MRKTTILFSVVLLVLAIQHKANADTDNWGNYKNYSEVIETMNKLVKVDGFAKVFDIGQTVNEIPIKAIVISKNANTSSKPAVIITGGIHAREWIGVEVALAIAQHLYLNRENQTFLFISKTMSVKTLLENIEVIIVPVLNPDGYKYSRNEHHQATGGTPYDIDTDIKANYYIDLENDPPRYADWRKNRRDVSMDEDGTGNLGDIYGVDINRNFPAFWEYHDSFSKLPQDYISYRGNTGGSENETQAVMSLYETRNVVAQIDYHSMGYQQILYPWAYSDLEIDSSKEELRPYSKTSDNKLLREMAERINVVLTTHKYEKDGGFFVGQHTYTAAGTARDWIYDTHKKAAFNIEVTASQDGFQPLWDRVDPICKQNIPGALWLMFWAADQGFRNKPSNK